MEWWKAAAAGVPLVAGTGVAGALIWFSRRWIVPPRVVFDLPSGDQAEAVEFASRDGTRLRGLLLRGRRDHPALVLCHGYQRSIEEPFALGVELWQRGFSVLVFDFRGCGRSDGRYTTLGNDEPDDVIAAVDWLRRRLGPRTPVGVLGISLGGSVALSAAARYPAIGAVVADSAFAHLAGAVEARFALLRFPMLHLHKATKLIAERLVRRRVRDVRPVDEVHRIAPRPVLFIHGDRDSIVPFSHLDELSRAFGPGAQTWALPDSYHAMARFDEPVAYVDRVASFFTTALSRSGQGSTGVAAG